MPRLHNKELHELRWSHSEPFAAVDKNHHFLISFLSAVKLRFHHESEVKQVMQVNKHKPTKYTMEGNETEHPANILLSHHKSQKEKNHLNLFWWIVCILFCLLFPGRAAMTSDSFIFRSPRRSCRRLISNACMHTTWNRFCDRWKCTDVLWIN